MHRERNALGVPAKKQVINFLIETKILLPQTLIDIMWRSMRNGYVSDKFEKCLVKFVKHFLPHDVICRSYLNTHDKPPGKRVGAEVGIGTQ